MKKLLIRSFLSLFICLLAGFSLQNNHAYKNPVSYSPIKSITSSEHSFGISHESPFLTIESTQFYKEKPRPKYKLRATDIEEEEEELPSSKKSTKIAKFSTSVFYGQLYEHSNYYSKNTIAFCKQLPFILANKRHIFFQVFRI